MALFQNSQGKIWRSTEHRNYLRTHKQLRRLYRKYLKWSSSTTLDPPTQELFLPHPLSPQKETASSALFRRIPPPQAPPSGLHAGTAPIYHTEIYIIGVMQMTEFSSYLSNVYHSEGSHDRITDEILPRAREWQQQPLEKMYPVIYLDGLVFSVHQDGQITKNSISCLWHHSYRP